MPTDKKRLRWLAIHTAILVALIVIFFGSRSSTPKFRALSFAKPPLPGRVVFRPRTQWPPNTAQQAETSTVQITLDQRASISATSQTVLSLDGPERLEPKPAAESIAKPALVPAPGFHDYVQRVPGQSFTIELVAIPGGTIIEGSPPDESGRDQNDQPQHSVTVKPFYLAKFETTWQQFLPYVFFSREEAARDTDRMEGIVDKDGVSHPTRPYGSVYRGRGEKGFPAIGMTELAAKEYCRWLSVKTGVRFRLPTEDEWEFACRAGATTTYFWADQAGPARQYAWYRSDSGDSTHPVGRLKPNRFGLYDMAGNVAEWTQRTASNAPSVARGGAWDRPVSSLRSAARLIEQPDWNDQDPQNPPSAWWLSTADFVGFRVLREVEGASAEVTRPEHTENVTPMAARSDSTSGQTRYTRYCAGCHGADGRGNTRLGQRSGARDYTDRRVKATLNASRMFRAIKEGFTKGGKRVMHPIGDKMTDDEIRAVIAYMRAL